MHYFYLILEFFGGIFMILFDIFLAFFIEFFCWL